MQRIRTAVLLGVLLPATTNFAQVTAGLKGLSQWAGVTGSIRGEYWSSSRTLDDREHLAASSLWLKATPTLGPNASLLLEGWIMNQQLFREDANDGALREAYLRLSLGEMDFRLGKQIIIWGRADRINPTDNLTPRNVTLLVPEDDDQRLGIAAVKASYYPGSFSLTGVWLPDFEPHTLPIRQPPSPLRIHERVPSETLEQWAVKIEQSGGKMDWSLSYFNGFDLSPDLGIAAPFDLALEHHRIRVIGADAATTWGRYNLRGEMAYTFTEDSEGKNPFVKNPFFFMVLGGDRTFHEYLNLNLQYFIRVVSRYQNPEKISDPFQQTVAIQQAVVCNQLDRVQQGASFRLSHKWFHETLEAEVAGALVFTRREYMIRPKVIYAFTDRWKGIVGADFFRGNQRSFFGNLRDNTTAYAELRLSF